MQRLTHCMYVQLVLRSSRTVQLVREKESLHALHTRIALLSGRLALNAINESINYCIVFYLSEFCC